MDKRRALMQHLCTRARVGAMAARAQRARGACGCAMRTSRNTEEGRELQLASVPRAIGFIRQGSW
eukprot:772173-Prymnesium_polylepis.3